VIAPNGGRAIGGIFAKGSSPFAPAGRAGVVSSVAAAANTANFPSRGHEPVG